MGTNMTAVSAMKHHICRRERASDIEYESVRIRYTPPVVFIIRHGCKRRIVGHIRTGAGVEFLAISFGTDTNLMEEGILRVGICNMTLSSDRLSIESQT